MRQVVIAALAACFLSFGCVKEERSACPCYLTLNFDKVIAEDGFREAVTTLGPCSDRLLDQERLELLNYESVGYERKVMKDLVRVSVVCGFKNGRFSNDCYLVPEHLQCDPIMAFALSRHCSGDRETAEVELHKQYCRIRFEFEGLDSRSKYPYELRVRANCNGIRLYDLEPVEGAYTAVAVESNSGALSVVLPRQKSNILSLDLMDSLAETLEVVDLGSELEKRGYDWNKIDLDDVDIIINIARADVKIEIKPWDMKYETVDI